ncbi:N protein [Eptesicus fuscus rhabdovirus]|uniref:Nucleoprotein n=1 Tax=Eptesicus fuscus rhabdovirus TaxID=2793798 RepID=A0A7T1NV61_9RHAB|nr:N protein [Eptesicus fuscus rhabdovirus]
MSAKLDLDEMYYEDVEGNQTPVVSKIAVQANVGEYYPETSPVTKIPFQYYKAQEWTKDALRNHVYNCLLNESLPAAEPQIAFLVEYIQSRTFEAKDDVKTGELCAKKGEVIPGNFLFNFEAITYEKAGVLGTTVSPPELESGLALWLLIQCRLKNINKAEYESHYKSILTKLREMLVLPPFNFPPSLTDKIPVELGPYRMTCGNAQIKKLGALMDYYSIISSSESDAKFRLATIGTRYADHLALNLLNSVVLTKQITLKNYMKFFISPRLAEEGLKILKPGQGIDKPFSLTPYSRAMELVTKSPYSLTETPCFCVMSAVFVACMGSTNQLNIQCPKTYIDTEITIALKLYDGLGLCSELRQAFFEKNSPNVKPERPVKSKKMSPDELVKKIIKEVQSQGGRPTVREKAIIVDKCSHMSRREGTLLSYIRTMTTYDPTVGPQEDLGGRSQLLQKFLTNLPDLDNQDEVLTQV